MKLSNKKWTEEEFFAMRKEVLAGWPTGEEVENLDASIEYCKQLPPQKNFYLGYLKSEEAGLIDTEISVGHATVEQTMEQIEHAEEFRPSSWCVYTDSYTRKLQFDQAKKGIERSYKEGFSALNGYPIVNWGIKNTRRITECTDVPIRINLSDSDARLAAEIALASGWTSLSSHNLQEVIQHARDFPLDKRIQYSQYTDRLASYYTEHGVPNMAVVAAVLNGWDAPGFKLTTNILQALLCAEQGVKALCMDYTITMNLIQDVALVKASEKVVQEYLSRFGHGDVHLSMQTIPWQGDWPRDPHRAAAVVAWSAATGILAGANRIKLKSIQEARATPSKEGMLGSLKIAKQLIQIMGQQRLPVSAEVQEEQHMLESEARATVDKVLEIGDGDVAVGMVRGVDAGVLDTFFSPWKPLHQDVIVVRDSNGAMRYLEHGNLPLPPEVIEYHRCKIVERAKKDNTEAGLNMLIYDATRISRQIV